MRLAQTSPQQLRDRNMYMAGVPTSRIRRVLGHRNLITTVKFYCGLETIAATDDFAKLIRDQMKFDSDD